MDEQRGLAVGESMTTGTARLTRDAAISFAREFDPQPMHIDEAAAKDGFFGTLVASGWHALSVTMRLVIDAQPLGDGPMVGVELSQIRFTRPVLPDTDLTARITLEAIIEGLNEKRYGKLKIETLDAATGDILIQQKWRVLCP